MIPRLTTLVLLAWLPAMAVVRPQAARAQTESARSSLVLRDGTQLKGYAHLTTVTKIPRMVILSARGEEQGFAPEEVITCQIGSHRFIVGGGFTVPAGDKGIEVSEDFIEVLDTTGSVQLFAYGYPRPLQVAAGYSSPGVGGMPGMMGGGEVLSPPYKVYLLRAKGGKTFLPYVLNVEEGFVRHKYRLANPTDAVVLQRLFADDPVLQQDILTGRVTEFQLPKAVAAYNQGKRRVAK